MLYCTGAFWLQDTVSLLVGSFRMQLPGFSYSGWSYILLGVYWYIVQLTTWWQGVMYTEARFSRNIRVKVVAKMWPFVWFVSGITTLKFHESNHKCVFQDIVLSLQPWAEHYWLTAGRIHSLWTRWIRCHTSITYFGPFAFGSECVRHVDM